MPARNLSKTDGAVILQTPRHAATTQAAPRSSHRTSAESADRDGTFELPKTETSPRRLGDLAAPNIFRLSRRGDTALALNPADDH